MNLVVHLDLNHAMMKNQSVSFLVIKNEQICLRCWYPCFFEGSACAWMNDLGDTESSGAGHGPAAFSLGWNSAANLPPSSLPRSYSSILYRVWKTVWLHESYKITNVTWLIWMSHNQNLMKIQSDDINRSPTTLNDQMSIAKQVNSSTNERNGNCPIRNHLNLII